MGTNDSADEMVKNRNVKVRFSEQLLDRVERRRDAGDFDNRSELLREAVRQYVLRAEVEERLDSEGDQ